MSDLGTLLHGWRDRVSPHEVGLPSQKPRRAPGLRREELASLAGVSVDYLTRLEQGRATAPSAQVLAALARALRLSDDERDHLFRMGGHQAPTREQVRSHLTPGIQRLLDRLDGVPVAVYDAGWNLLSWNRLWSALMGDPTELGAQERNLVWRTFLGPPSRVEHSPAEQEAFRSALVADLRSASGRYPRDEALRSLVASLCAASPLFAELWASGIVGEHPADRKTIRHPQVGPVTLDCDVFTASGSDLRIVSYTAVPGSADAEALALLGVLGTQSLV